MAFVSELDKQFFHQKGEVLAFVINEQFLLFKIIDIDAVGLQKGRTYNIAGIEITAPEDDFFLCIPITLSQQSFPTFEEAITTLKQNQIAWLNQLSPMRPSGIYSEKLFSTNTLLPISQDELNTYMFWKQQFLQGFTGVY